MLIMQKVVYMLADVERETNAGLPRSEVVQRYLEDLEGEMTGIEQLEAETVLIEKVLTKLVKVSLDFDFRAAPSSSLTSTHSAHLQEKYLLELRGSGLVEDDAEETDDDPILSVHPECEVDVSGN